MDYMLRVNVVIKYSINTRLWHYCSTAAEEEVSVNCKCEGFKADIYGTENEWLLTGMQHLIFSSATTNVETSAFLILNTNLKPVLNS